MCVIIILVNDLSLGGGGGGGGWGVWQQCSLRLAPMINHLTSIMMTHIILLLIII